MAVGEPTRFPPHEVTEKQTKSLVFGSLHIQDSFPHQNHLIVKPQKLAPYPPKPTYADILTGVPKKLENRFCNSGLIKASNIDGVCNGSVQLKPTTRYLGKPAVFFSNSEKLALIQRMKYVLVAKFSHGKPGLAIVKDFFANFHLKSRCNISVYDSKHLILDCEAFEDFVKIWMCKNCMVGGFLMRVFKWSEDFHPSLESSICPVWVHLPGLPLYLYQEDILMSIANTIGRPLALDLDNINRSKLGCATFCVEVDISIEVIDKIWIAFDKTGHGSAKKGIWQQVIFDPLPHYCNRCDHLGHPIVSCLRLDKLDHNAVRGDFVEGKGLPGGELGTGGLQGLQGKGLLFQQDSSAKHHEQDFVEGKGLSGKHHVPLQAQVQPNSQKSGAETIAEAATGHPAAAAGTVYEMETAADAGVLLDLEAGAEPATEDVTAADAGMVTAAVFAGYAGTGTAREHAAGDYASGAAGAGSAGAYAAGAGTEGHAVVAGAAETAGTDVETAAETTHTEFPGVTGGKNAAGNIAGPSTRSEQILQQLQLEDAQGNMLELTCSSEQSNAEAAVQHAKATATAGALSGETLGCFKGINQVEGMLLKALKIGAVPDCTKREAILCNDKKEESKCMLDGMTVRSIVQTEVLAGNSAGFQDSWAVLIEAQIPGDFAGLGTGSSNDGSTQGRVGQDMEKEEGEMVEGLGLLNDPQSWADLVEEEDAQQLPPTGAIKSESEGADGSESECKQTGTQQGDGTNSEERQQKKMMDWSTIEGFAMEEIEMLMASPTRMDPVFTLTVPNLNNEAILDLEGTPVLCSEVIRKSSRIVDVRKHFQFLSNEKLVAAMVEEGKYEDFIMDAMKAYTKEIHRTFLEQEKSIYPKDSATEKVTSMTQEAIPKVSTMDEKEWTTPKRRGRNRNRPK